MILRLSLMPIHNRSTILPATPDGKVNKPPDEDEAKHYDRPIHVHRRNGCRWREEGEHHGDKRVDEGDDIHWEAPATKLPGSEGNGFFEESLSHHETDGDEVRGEEPGDDE